ncbi:MAG: hypothetical protein K9W46_01570 [Candidatus Heimdallarchaeum endolithica]|uniref:Uncharacterized protein n=1 Tax=Candidatus Heimdallarchaeum endolithica TaxID=2876572 RepID=A0A9Y1FNL8_9ARCH|nr:MAG: hypothetical protein K9W46_01570 [Candidatus Heimdallarchaeum endolithica]
MSNNRAQIIFVSVFVFSFLFPALITLGDKCEISIEPGDQFDYIIGKNNAFLGTIKIISSDNLTFNFTLKHQTGSEVVSRRYVQSILFHFIGKGNYTIQIRNLGEYTLKINLSVETKNLNQENSERYTTDNDSVCWQILANNKYNIISLKDLKYGEYDAYVDIMGGIGNIKVYITQTNPEVVEEWLLYSDEYEVNTQAFLRKFTIDRDSKYWIIIKSEDEKEYQVTLTLILTNLKKDNGTIFLLTAAAFIAMLTLYLNKLKRKHTYRKSASALKAREEGLEQFKSLRLQSAEEIYSNIKLKKR